MAGDFKVDFIGVAALRSGTTWISQCLAGHPQICFSSRKETHFFDRAFNLEKGVSFYESFFKECPEGKIKGEYTPSYYLDENAAVEIKKYFPDVKIFMCLRNPAERAISHYVYDKKRALVEKDFSEILARPDNRYIADGFYHSHLSKFLKHFNPENVFIAIHEDTKSNPSLFMKNLYEFIGVDGNFAPAALFKKINLEEDVGCRILFINKIINKRKVLRNYGAGRALMNFLKFVGVNNVVKLILEMNMAKGPDSGGEEGGDTEDLFLKHKEKLARIYAADVKKLEKMLGRDLSGWRLT